MASEETLISRLHNWTLGDITVAAFLNLLYCLWANV